MRIRDRDGEEFHRVGIDLPAGLLADIEEFSAQDQRKRADWIRITLGSAVRARKAKKGQRA